MPDDVLARLADNGGTCMVTFVPRFVNQAVRDWAREAAAAAPRNRGSTRATSPPCTPWRPAHETRRHRSPPADLADVVAHLEHVREVAGIDHIGLGGDYDGVDWLPEGLEDVTGYPRLLAALAERGWSDDDLAKADLPQRAADDAGRGGRRGARAPRRGPASGHPEGGRGHS